MFVSFLVALLYFMHNLIIANVYEMYSTSMTDRVVRRNNNRRVALERAFKTLDLRDEGWVKKGERTPKALMRNLN